MDHHSPHSHSPLRHPQAALYQVTQPSPNNTHYHPYSDQDARTHRTPSSTCVPSLIPPGMDPAHVDMRTFYPYTPNEVKHRKRTTRAQLKILEEVYKTDTKPNGARRRKLASELEMSPRGVQVWFQNRRAKTKQLAKKEAAKRAGTVHKDEPDYSASPVPPSTPLLASQSNSPSLSPEGASPDVDISVSSTAPSTPNVEAVTPQPERSPLASNTSPFPPAHIQTSRSGSAPAGTWPIPTPSSAPASAQATSSFQLPYSASHLAPPDASLYNLRRPSLPTLASHVQPLSHTHSLVRGFDPAARRRSCVDPHALRLSSHPYAHLAVAANESLYPEPPHTPSSAHMFHAPHQRRPILTQRMTVPTLYGVPSAPPPQPHTLTRHPSLNSYEQFVPSAPPPHTAQFAHGQEHSRGHGQGHGYTIEQYALSQRAVPAPIPGPLPAPDFSFGAPTGSPSITREEEDGGSEEHECEYDYASERGMLSRFGSVASVGGSESSWTSAYMSEPGSVGKREEAVVTVSMAGNESADDIANGRRGSCASTHFLEMFSGLEVDSQRPQGPQAVLDQHSPAHPPMHSSPGLHHDPCALNHGQNHALSHETVTNQYPVPAPIISGGGAHHHVQIPRHGGSHPRDAPSGAGSSSLAFALHASGTEEISEMPDLSYPPSSESYNDQLADTGGTADADFYSHDPAGLAKAAQYAPNGYDPAVASDVYAMEVAAYGSVLAYGGDAAGDSAPNPIYGSGAIELNHMCVPASVAMEYMSMGYMQYS
ncbi:hypothetical protein B0H21DRAFT_52407 [Amylocystis lapponica]|nr:hypothetical protein B0H21DRAFT_52407 [Amylocystis lapponica]